MPDLELQEAHGPHLSHDEHFLEINNFEQLSYDYTNRLLKLLLFYFGKESIFHLFHLNTASTWLEYCQYGIKPKTINHSIYENFKGQEKNYFDCLLELCNPRVFFKINQ